MLTRDPGHSLAALPRGRRRHPTTAPNYAPSKTLYRISLQPRPASSTWLHRITKLQRVNAGQCVGAILARLMSRARQNLLPSWVACISATRQRLLGQVDISLLFFFFSAVERACSLVEGPTSYLG